MSVFTSITASQLKIFLNDYSVGKLRDFTGIEAGITNSNFFVNTDSGRYVLTIVEQEKHADVEWFMQLLGFLHQRKIPCALPIASASGNYTSTLVEKPATLVECLKGADKNIVTEKNCHAIGETVANFHSSCRSYPAERQDSRGVRWRQQTADKVRSKLDVETLRVLEEQMRLDSQTLLDTLPCSVIHADLFRDNVLFVDNKISGIIDFYYACNGCMLYDLAITFNDWCRDNTTAINHNKAKSLLAGYESVRPLEAIERDVWPDAVRRAALRFWLSRLHDLHFPPDALMTYTKDPAPLGKILTETPCRYVDLAT